MSIFELVRKLSVWLVKDASRDACSKDLTDARSRVHKYELRPRPLWSVRPGEDLRNLARRLFGDAKLSWLIADINAAKINEAFDGKKRIIELSVGQKIELPVWQDIVEFHKLKFDFRVSEIITMTK